jgi:hypothetical protein
MRDRLGFDVFRFATRESIFVSMSGSYIGRAEISVRSPEDIRISDDAVELPVWVPDLKFNAIAQPAAITTSVPMRKSAPIRSRRRWRCSACWLLIFGEGFKKFDVVFGLCDAVQERFCSCCDVHPGSNRWFDHLSEHPPHQPYAPREIWPKQ